MTYYRINSEEVIKEIQKQSLKREWVAGEAGVHVTTLRRWLKGRIDKVKEENIMQLAKVLSLPKEQFSVKISNYLN